MTVTGCDDCPLCVGEHDGAGKIAPGCAYCSAPGPNQTRCVGEGRRQVQSQPFEAGAPDWCPLRTAPLTIALEGHGALCEHDNALCPDCDYMHWPDR